MLVDKDININEYHANFQTCKDLLNWIIPIYSNWQNLKPEDVNTNSSTAMRQYLTLIMNQFRFPETLRVKMGQLVEEQEEELNADATDITTKKEDPKPTKKSVEK